MNKLTGSTNLEDLLNSALSDSLKKMERGHSPFEKAIRKMNVSVCDVFTTSGVLAPVTFTPGTQVLEPRGEIADAFPNSIAASQNRILSAGGVLAAKITGKRVAVLFSGGP